MATKEELLEQLKTGVIEFEEEKIKETSTAWLAGGHAPLDGIMEGLAAGMLIVGEMYENQEYFVPEVLMCSDAMYAGLNILRPHVPKSTDNVNAQVVIGSIEGDVHDIGKNIVKMMFDVAGWEVHDLGRNVPLEKFVEEQLRTDSEVVALSAMMTTTMLGMEKVVKMIKEKNPNVAIMLGGAPVTKNLTDLYGADGYAESAGNAVSEAIKMIGRLREFEQNKTE